MGYYHSNYRHKIYSRIRQFEYRQNNTIWYAHMRTKLVDGELIEFTAAEETERDAEELINTLDTSRQLIIEAITVEGVTRIAAEVPEWDDLETIRLIKSFINLMDFTKATPAQVLARNIHDYARSRIVIMKAADQATIDAYDPVADPNWPT